MKGSISQVFVTLFLIVGCGFQSVNRVNSASCPAVDDIIVNTPPGFADWSEHLRFRATKEFQHRANGKPSTILRVQLERVDHTMSNFNGLGQLSGTAIRLRVSVDLVQGTRMLWAAQSEPIEGIVQHTGTPRTTVMNMNESMQAQITEGLRTLGRAYRQQCALAADRKDTE